MKEQTLTIFSLSIIFFSSLITNAQTNKLSESDNAQIIATILKHQKFKEPKAPRNKTEKVVYFLTEDTSLKSLPNTKGIKFKAITERQIKEMSRYGVEYYWFSEFEDTGKAIEVSVIKEYINSTTHYLLSEVTKYDCRKVAGRWRIKGGKLEVEIGEGR